MFTEMYHKLKWKRFQQSIKYFPVTSIDVERTFYAFKRDLDGKGQYLTVENVEKCIAYCNKNYSQREKNLR